MYSGKDLRQFREKRGWSLRQFSTVVGVSVKTLQVMEKEDKAVPLQLRLALAALKAGVDEYYPIGGAQAVAALAFLATASTTAVTGTASIARSSILAWMFFLC